MFKKSVFIFLLVISFISGCAERGSLVNIPSSNKTTMNKTQQIPKLVLHNSRDDAFQKGVSGSLIFIIGLILIF